MPEATAIAQKGNICGAVAQKASEENTEEKYFGRVKRMHFEFLL